MTDTDPPIYLQVIEDLGIPTIPLDTDYDVLVSKAVLALVETSA